MAKENKNVNTRRRSRILFYTLMMALPIMQICLCYLYVNANMFITAFQKHAYKVDGSLGYDVMFTLDNFKVAFDTFVGCGDMIKRSLLLVAINMFIGFPLALIFSFYIYKDYAGAKFFKVMLFLPQIISGLILALLFRYVANDVYTTLVFKITGEKVEGLLSVLNPKMELVTLIFYNVWVSFGVKTLMFSGSMSGIDDSIVESAQLDGVNLFQEFMHITLPLVYGTVVQFIIIQVVAVFTDGMHIMSFYSHRGNHVATLGYFLFVQADTADYILSPQVNYTFGQLSALGIILTFIVLPITLVIRKLLTKFGPSVE